MCGNSSTIPFFRRGPASGESACRDIVPLSARRLFAVWCVLVWLVGAGAAEASWGAEPPRDGVEPGRPGIVAVIDIDPNRFDAFWDEVARSKWLYYVQLADPSYARSVRAVAYNRGLLGNRVVVFVRSHRRIGLSDNVANRVVVTQRAAEKVLRSEVLRVLQPRGTADVGGLALTKPVPEGSDDWSHPYHGPDNNPQSNDALVKGHFQTQFLGFPKFSPMPEQTVIAGGRIYKAMGHIAHKANQNAMLNTLLCIDAYNGTVRWRRTLPKGFMIHRNTMVATDDALYLGDDHSCKVIDGETGKVRDEITVPADITDGPVWKWMAIRGDVLYALVGHEEIHVDTVRSNRRGLGHWPWGMWQGHDYKDPRVAFGFGRTLVAIDLKTKSVRWHYRDEAFLDGRAVCMNDEALFAYAPGKYLIAISLDDGKPVWKNGDRSLLDAIGPNGRAQLYITGYATTCYLKCHRDYLFFAGPQREKLVAASTHDGKLAWTFPIGNLQLVLRPDALWAAGPQNQESGFKIDYKTGKVLSRFPSRRACTRATGCADSIFFRASGGTVRVLTDSATAQHIAPMRPPCQDGVLIAGGHLYWGPWMCGCQLSLYGNVALAPLGPPPTDPDTIYDGALVTWQDYRQVRSVNVRPDDWPTYRRDNARSSVTPVAIADRAPRRRWSVELGGHTRPTAPVAAADLVFVADGAGMVHVFDASGNRLWEGATDGAIFYPPAVTPERVVVGSADGRVYAWETHSGRELWSFRVAPKDEAIPVYGRLMSRWPVAGGVVVQDGIVYAAAGLTHYDGTYVVALDAETGRMKRANTTSGQLAPEVNDGISLQGKLTIEDDELRFLAGGVYETARFDLETLKCLNEPRRQVHSQFRTAFYPYYPEYGKYVSVDYRLPDGRKLEHDASYEGSRFTDLALHEPLPPGVKLPRKEAARWIMRRGGKPPKTIWRDRAKYRFTSYIISSGNHRMILAGHPAAAPQRHLLVCLDIETGKELWTIELKHEVVKGGTAIDGAGRLYVVTRDGRLTCYE